MNQTAREILTALYQQGLCDGADFKENPEHITEALSALKGLIELQKKAVRVDKMKSGDMIYNCAVADVAYLFDK